MQEFGLNVGQRQRDTFWGDNLSVNAGVTGKVTGNCVYFIYWASSTGTRLEHVQEQVGFSKARIITFTLMKGGEKMSACRTLCTVD